MREPEASMTRTAAGRPERGAPAGRSGDRPSRQWGPILWFVAAMGVVSLLAAERTTGVFGWWPGAGGGDQISERQARARADSYVAALPLQLTPVAPDDLPRALASMGLTEEAQRALVAELDRRGANASLPHGTGGASPGAAGPGIPLAQPAGAAVDTKAAPAAAPRQGLPLAWITLWDTEAEDGDVVRVDSGGYSRTVTLSHAPVAFAIPVPLDGMVQLTGVHDGGGGITVGASSGQRVLALPLMSTGQVLRIPIGGK